MPRVVYATNAPAPYKIGMLNAMNRKIPDFEVIYLTGREYMRRWEDPLTKATHSYRLMHSWRLNLKSLETAQYLSLRFFCSLWRPWPTAVILAPYNQIVFIAAFLICRLMRVPVIIWYESHDLSSVSPSGLRGFGRCVKRWLFRWASAVVVPGKMARENALALGVAPKDIVIAPHSVENEMFAVAAGTSSWSPRLSDIAMRLRNYDRVLLYVGQFVSRKNLILLQSAFAETKDELGNCCLLLIGDDPAKITPLHNDVLVGGFLQPAELVELYHLCHALVLPSISEVWGLVVNEATAAGLPVLVSSRCGASEVIIDGLNGYVFDPSDAASLRQTLLRWRAGSSIFDRNEIQRQTMNRYNFDAMAEAFHKALFLSRAT